MAQTITDFRGFLDDAKQVLEELGDLKAEEARVKDEEERSLSALEAEKKAVADNISATVRRRREEISKSYDSEIGKGQERLKKIRARREKAKIQGIKERIQEETSELHSYNRELAVRMRTLFQKEHVPPFCRTGLFYALYLPRGLRESLTLLASLAVCFLLVPYGAYMLLPEQKTLYLILIYFACILVFGGLYTVIGNVTKGKHREALREGRAIRNLILSNHKKIRIITNTIRRDKNEALYNLEKYDDEISQLEQDMDDILKKKKEALNTFENVTKTIISDEITENSRGKINALSENQARAEDRLRYIQTILKEKQIFLTDTYETYLGREFLAPDRLDRLKEILESGAAVNLSDAMEVYRKERQGYKS